MITLFLNTAVAEVLLMANPERNTYLQEGDYLLEIESVSDL